MKRVDVFFSGYYGMGNYGDDLFAVTALKAADHYWPRARCSLDVPAGYLDDLSFQRLIRTSPELRQGSGKLSRLARIRDCFVGASRADHFVVAGGSTMTSGRLNARTLTMHGPGRLLGTRFSALGVSVGPFKTSEDRRRFARHLARLDYLSVRDGKSVEEVKAIDPGVRAVRAADLAGVYARLHPGPAGRARVLQTVGFAPCRQRDGSDRRLCDAFVGAMEMLSREIGTRPQVHLFCLNVHPRLGDLELWEYARRELTERGFDVCSIRYDSIGVAAAWERIAETDLFVSGRLHGAMTAYLQGLPFIVHEYHAKCTDWLCDIGAPAEFGLAPAALVPDEVFRRMMAVRDLQPDVTPAAYSARAELSFTSAPWASAGPAGTRKGEPQGV